MSRKIRPHEMPVKTTLRAKQKSTKLSTSPAITQRTGLVIIRAAGGRELGVFSQVRALFVEANGDARLLALSHTRGTNVHSHVRARRSISRREVAA